MNRREVLAGGLSALSAVMLAPRSLAYPDRAIRLVVPFSPGGATDVAGRLWAEKMKRVLGTVVTENRGGGGGVTGAAEAARAQPDGHTFLFGNTSTQVLIPAIMPNPPYDPLKDFIGIYILCNAPTSIVVHASVPARNLAELIAYARANPGKLSYGSARGRNPPKTLMVKCNRHQSTAHTLASISPPHRPSPSASLLERYPHP